MSKRYREEKRTRKKNLREERGGATEFSSREGAYLPSKLADRVPEVAIGVHKELRADARREFHPGEQACRPDRRGPESIRAVRLLESTGERRANSCTASR